MATIALEHLQILWVLRTSSAPHSLYDSLCDFTRSSLSSTSGIWSALPSKHICISTLSSLLMPPRTKWFKSPSFIIISLYLVSHFSLFSICVHFPSQSKSQSPYHHLQVPARSAPSRHHPSMTSSPPTLLAHFALDPLVSAFLWTHLASFRSCPCSFVFLEAYLHTAPWPVPPLHLFKGSCLVSIYLATFSSLLTPFPLKLHIPVACFIFAP